MLQNFIVKSWFACSSSHILEIDLQNSDSKFFQKSESG
ncbi:hypothetical protein LEP1GSC064_1406 [Leptospira kirschneri serovar Grippotyphosa str. Moskva]|nr:hypothetical protein LEP1GSC064_1406 [Leptospira kirschneri serovar Grippotyphosa str. Moskva]